MATPRPPQEFVLDIATADDGIRPLREAHDWTREKLGILASYLPAYAKACKRARPIYFVDGMSGPGLYHINETGEFLRGSTLIALSVQDYPFEVCLAMDINEDAVDALKARTFGTQAQVRHGNCNLDLMPAMQQHVPPRSPTFVLLDPEGAELEWQTVSEIGKHRLGPKKPELCILFATAWLPRMLPVEGDIEAHNEIRLNRLFPPNAGWRATWQRRRTGELTPAGAQRGYLDGYCDGLRQLLGYKHVRRREVKTPTGRLMYHLVFATDDDVGERIMTHVFETMYPNDPQLRML